MDTQQPEGTQCHRANFGEQWKWPICVLCIFTMLRGVLIESLCVCGVDLLCESLTLTCIGFLTVAG